MPLDRIERDKLKYEIEKSLSQAKDGIMPFLAGLSGYTFLGRKNLKDGTYVSTCWLTFCYIPIAPLDTYQIQPDGSRGMLPRVFGMHEYIPFDRSVINFNYFQAFSYGIVISTFTLSVLFFAFIYPLITLAGLFASVSFFSIYQLAKKPKESENLHNTISDLKSRLQEGSKVSEIHTEEKKVIEKEVPVPKPSVVAPQATATKVEFIVPKPEPAKPMATKPLMHAPVVRDERSTLPIPPKSYGRFSNFAQPLPEVVEEVVEKPRNGLIFWGIINIALIFAYVFYYGYFTVNSKISGHDIWIYKILTILNHAHLISFISFNVGLIITLFRSKVIGFILIILAIALFFNLEARMWAYLFDCCL